MTTKKNRTLKTKLDAYEQGIEQTLERGEWINVNNEKKEIIAAKKAAIKYMRKEARINIRLSTTDLEHIKQKAAYEGLPYQTLIASILHKYASGHM